MGRVHADRREPAEPHQPLALEAAADELLREASELSSGRAARTLTPGAGAPMKQTLVAITRGHEMSDHVGPGSATIQVLRGALTVTWDGDHLEVADGQWAILPTQLHRVRADADTVAIVTAAPDS
jgi:quercetin dioxygenase-like cupin family protein